MRQMKTGTNSNREGLNRVFRDKILRRRRHDYLRTLLSESSWTVEMMDAITCSHFHCMLARNKKQYEKEIPTLQKQCVAVRR